MRTLAELVQAAHDHPAAWAGVRLHVGTAVLATVPRADQFPPWHPANLPPELAALPVLVDERMCPLLWVARRGDCTLAAGLVDPIAIAPETEAR